MKILFFDKNGPKKQSCISRVFHEKKKRTTMSGVEKKIELRFSVVFLNLGRRPYLTHLDVSVENGLFRLKPKSGFFTQSTKGFFYSTFFD